MTNDAVRDVPPVERLIEIALFTPFTVGAAVVQRAPAAVRQARQDLVAARVLGEMAVNEGLRRVRARNDGSESCPSEVSPRREVEPVPDEVPTAVGDSDVLALPDYDHLPAVDIVAKLPALSTDERDQIEAYERTHRRRRTVLGKIEQLRT